jgi:hypothetical protein
MDTGRTDLNSMIKVASIPDAEPTFILRAQDAVAADTVRAWVALAAMEGAPPAVLEQALIQADRMAAWPVKKLAGDDHLALHERKQLENQHRRRQWDAGEGLPIRLALGRDFQPRDPVALLEQLAFENQEVADRLMRQAEYYQAQLDSASAGATPLWRTQHAQAHADTSSRAAYFATVARALRLGAAAIGAAAANPSVQP